MDIYYVIFGFLAFFMFFENTYGANMKALAFFVSVFLIFFLGLRVNVGNDFLVYYANFEKINYGLEVGSKEPLYLLVNKLMPSAQFVFFFFSFFTIFFFHKGMKYFVSENMIAIYSLFFSFYFIIFNIHLLRQGLAISIVLFSYKYLFNNKIKIFFGLVFLASLFHKSALFVLLLPLLLRFEINIKKNILILIIAFLFTIFSDSVIDFIYSIGSRIPIFSNYLLVYRQKEFTGNSAFSIGVLFDVLLVVYCLINKNKFDKKEFFLFKIAYVSVIISLLLTVAPIALRLNYYYRITNIMILTILISKIKFRFLYSIMLFVISLLYFRKNFNSETIYGRSDRNLYYKSVLKDIF